MSSSKPLVKFSIVLAATTSINGWCQKDPGDTPEIYDRIWAAPVLYENADNPTIQSFSLIGRYHGQYWSVDADQGSDRDWENRRMLVGFSSKWFQDFTLQAQVHLKSGSGSIYDGLYED